VMHRSLKSVGLAMRGLIVLSSELEEMAVQMYNNMQPALWKSKSYPSLKPLASYVHDFVLRMAFYQDWISHGKPSVFWLSGIFFTHALLTGSLQNYARKNRFPIDVVVYDFEVMSTADPEAVGEPPMDGMLVRGLYIEGAVWSYDSEALDEATPKVLYGEVPIIWFRPTAKDKLKMFKHYVAPMYRTGDRRGTLATTGHSTNFVMKVRLPSTHDPAHWIKRGAALLTTLAD